MGNGFFPTGADGTAVRDGEKTVKAVLYGHRSIAAKTFEVYDVRTKIENDIPGEVGFRYPNGSYKIRDLRIPKKEKGHFRTIGPMATATLFGKDKFDAGSKDSITITEGEYDALAAYELLRGKTAAVSVRSSSSAVQDIQNEYEYVNSFSKIYLCLDGDEAGQAKIAKIASMFDFNKLYHVKLEKYKDANAYLANGAADEFVKTWSNARRYSPSAIISSFSEIRNALKLRQAEVVADYPFTELQEALNGIHRGELIVIKGKQGIGKTEICRAIVDDMLKNRKNKMATIFLEEDMGTTIKGVATYQMKLPAMREDSGLSEDEIMDAYEKAVGGKDDRLYIHTHFSSDDEDELINNIRFLVTVAGVDVIFLDNLTVLNLGRDDNDERIRIDRTVRKLRALVNELKFGMVLIAHTNDDGTTRGSRFPDIVANTVISMAREKPECELYLNVEKARTQGSKEGPASFAYYDRMQYVLRQPTEEEGGPTIVPDL
jgi:KaiC/GvpD/RAD55 family RecA-like ATPase